MKRILSRMNRVQAVGIVLACVTPLAHGESIYRWQPLGSGLGEAPAYVWKLCVYNGQLVAGGQFSTAGDVPCNNIASWDGSRWQPLGGGLTGVSSPYIPLCALTTYNGQLVAGGCFTMAGGVSCGYIASWNGSGWQPLGSGMDGFVTALGVYNGQLVAGGYFTTAGGVQCNGIASWDGTAWHSMGGITGTDPCFVAALAVYNGQLVAAGSFTSIGGVECSNIALWNGSAWEPLGGGRDTPVEALAVYNGQLVAGGPFTTAGGVASTIASWDGSNWQSLDDGILSQFGSPYTGALIVWDGQLVAAGQFSVIGNVFCDNIACWNGSEWQALGPLGGFAISGFLSALTIYDGQLVAGGLFGGVSDVTCNSVAQWKLVPAGTVRFGSAAYAANRSDSSVAIAVTRDGDASDAVTVEYATSDGTGVAGVDYTATSGTLTFGRDETSKSFTVPILRNFQASGDSTVDLTLSNPTGAALHGPNVAVLTIKGGGCGNHVGVANLGAFYALCWTGLAVMKWSRRSLLRHTHRLQ